MLSHPPNAFPGLLIFNTVGDALMAVASAYYLLQRKPENGLKRTDDLVNALVRLTFQCAVPAALWYVSIQSSRISLTIVI